MKRNEMIDFCDTGSSSETWYGIVTGRIHHQTCTEDHKVPIAIEGKIYIHFSVLE